MPEVRRRRLDRAAWISLRESRKYDEEGQYAHDGYRESFSGAIAVAFDSKERETVDSLENHDFGLHSSQRGGNYVDGEYLAADVYHANVPVQQLPEPFHVPILRKIGWISRRPIFRNLFGTYLALEQVSDEAPVEWHLHQDLVVTLGLVRDVDSWLCVDRGFEEAARLVRNEDGAPARLEVKSEYLKDYLCARGMVLRVSSFQSRTETVADRGHILWTENPQSEVDRHLRWEGRVTEIHEGDDVFGGMQYGSKWHVFRAERVDVDAEEDVPTFSGAEGIRSSSFDVGSAGRKLFTITGELWKDEWVEPGAASPIARGDEVPSNVEFIIEASGERETGSQLDSGRLRWIWFRPEVVEALLDKRGSALRWYTAYTGSVGCSRTGMVHFGINPLGYVNVLAKDIGMLPEWQQRIWAAYNAAPDGGVSKELTLVQNAQKVPETQAPEDYIERCVRNVNDASTKVYGVEVFRHHDFTQQLYRKAHRFRAHDKASLYELAKDLARLTADSIDGKAINSITKGKLGPLKALQALLATKIPPSDAYDLMGPLFGIYELRLADAHLPSADADVALALVGVDESKPFVHQGFEMLSVCVATICAIARVLMP